MVATAILTTKSSCTELEQGDARKAASAKPRKNIIWNVCVFILMTEMCERLCYYGLTGSMKVFLTQHLDFSNEMASSMTTVLPAIVYVTPLLGGYIADVHWGRYKTILVFSVIYVTGCALLAASSYSTVNSSCMFLVGLFVFVGLGSGGIKANVITLGGDQFDTRKEVEAKQQETFFNYFYWSINLGALFSYGYLSQLVINGQGTVIPAADGFFAAFLICGIALTISVLLFAAFSGRYVKTPPSGSAFANFVASFVGAARASWRGRLVLAAFGCQFLGFILSTASAFMVAGTGASPALVLSLAGMALCVFGLVVVVVFCINPTWVHVLESGPRSQSRLQHQAGAGTDAAKATLRASVSVAAADQQAADAATATTSTATITTITTGGSGGLRRASSRSMMQRAFSVSMSMDAMDGDFPFDAARAAASSAKTFEFLRIMPTLMFSVIFWIVYDQMSANFYSQACQTNLFFNQREGAQLNGSVLNIADCLAIIICIPLFDQFVYPWVERCKGSAYTPLQKIGTGFVFAFLAMAAAIAIEFARRAAPPLTLPGAAGGGAAISKCSAGGQKMSDLSVYWMLIPYFLIGVAECLISVQMYDICYNEVPEELRSTAQAVNLFMTAISGAIAGAISKSFAGYVHDDLNVSHIEYQYYVAAALALAALPLFAVCTHGFEYKSRDNGAVAREWAEAEADAQELAKMPVPGTSANLTTE